MAIISNLEPPRELSGSLTKRWVFDTAHPVYSDIVAGDVNGDGKREILFKSDAEEHFAHSTTGQKLWSFALTGESEMERLFLDKESIKIVCSNPVLADINDDGKQEIIIGGANGKLYVLTGDGRKLWEYQTNGPIHSTPAVLDINNDGKKEIIFGSNDHNLYVLDMSGRRVWTFETSLEIESGIAVADINNDGKQEIIFGSNDNKIYALNNEGDLLWTFQTNGPINATPRLGDIHNNGQVKIIIGSNDGYVYVLKNNGNLEWKYKTNGSIVSEVSLVDINFDNKLEIIVTSCSYEENLLILSNMRDKIGSYGAGFWVTSSTAVTDIDRDGNYEIVFGSYDHHVYILTFKRDLQEYFRGELEQQVRIFNTASIVVGTPCVVQEEETLVIAATDNGKVIALRV